MTNQPHKIIFMGTPDFAVPALAALHQAGHTIVAAYSQPPKPVGRGHKIQKMPVHIFAEEKNIPVYTPKTLRTEEAQAKLRALEPDFLIVAAYGLILPQEVLDIPRLGSINIHGSLLPRWRGAAPIQRALLAGDTETGITIMRMEAGLDTGAMLMKQTMPITETTTAQDIHDTLSSMGAEMIVKALELLAKNELPDEKQNDALATYAHKLSREESQIDWQKPAADLDRQIRAFTPWPSSFFMLGDEKIKIIKATLVTDMNGKAGTLLDKKFSVACGTGALRLDTLQRPGKKPTDGASILNGLRLEIGQDLL